MHTEAQRPWWRLLPFLVSLICLTGIAPQPYALRQALARSRMLHDQDKPAQAAQALAQAAERLPERPRLWELAGMAALRGSQPEAAQRYFEHAQSAGQLSAAGLLSLGDACFETGSVQAAEEAWKAAFASGAPAVEVYRRRLAAARQQVNLSAQLSNLQALTALLPADGELRYELGLLQAALEPTAAAATLAQAAELAPSRRLAAENLGRILRRGALNEDEAYIQLVAGRQLAAMEEWSLAAAAFRRVVDLQPGYAEAWAYLGEAYQHLPASSGLALTALEQAYALDPDALSINLLLGLYYRRQGDFQTALDYVAHSARQHPQEPQAWVEFGHLQAVLGNLDGAAQALQHAASLAPRRAEYARYIASFSLQYTYQLRLNGLPAARKAVLLAPQDPAGLDLLGQVLYRLGDFNSAERFYWRALQTDPNYAAAHLHLGLLALEQDHRLTARHKWLYVIDLAPDSPAAEQARRLLTTHFP